MYSRIHADSAIVTEPSVITGDLPSGWIACSDGGASIVAGSRSYLTSSYGTSSSSSSQSTRCERELFRWWTVITNYAYHARHASEMVSGRRGRGRGVLRAHAGGEARSVSGHE